MAIEPITIDEITSGKPTKVGEIEPISPEELFGEVTPIEAVPTPEVSEKDAIPQPNIFDLMLNKSSLELQQIKTPEGQRTTYPIDEFDAGEFKPIFGKDSMQSLDKTWKEVNETLGEFAELTADPIKFAKGVGELAFSIPGFLVGLPVATQRIVETSFKQIVEGQTLNLEEVYFAAAEGMQKTMEAMQPGVEAVWGKTDEQRQLVGAVAMAPLTGLSTLGSEIAGWKGFEDYPNIRGAARFSGDIAGFLALGAVYGRGRKTPVAAKIRDAAKKAEDIKVAEEILEQVPEDAVKRAKEKTLEVEKKQLELELIELKKKIELDAEVKKDLKKKGKKVKEIKEEGIETEAIREERLEFAKEKIEGIEPLEGPPEVVEPKVKVKKVEPKVKEPTTELDLQTDTSLPTLEGEQSPFFTNREATENLKYVYERKAEAVIDDVEIYSQKLINDVNRWYHGDEGIDIAKVRNDLSELATRADELRMNFVSVADFNAWRETVSEAAVWGRRIKPDRLKIERREKPLPSVDLNMMVPLGELPKAVADIYRGVKDLKVRNIFRDKEVFDKTGFWFGKDGFWRYEVDDKDASFVKSFLPPKPGYTSIKVGTHKLGDIYNHPKLYKAFPHLKDIDVVVNPGLPDGKGVYYAAVDQIEISNMYDVPLAKRVLSHEIQHAVNEGMGAFQGTSLEVAGRETYMKTPGEMEARLTEARLSMTAEKRKAIPPWKTLDDILPREGIRRDVGTKLYSGIPVDEVTKGVIRAYRGGSRIVKGKLVSGIMAQTEGKGLYVALTREHAKQFGDTVIPVDYRIPKNPLLVKGEELPLLDQEMFSMWEPFEKGDSVWIRSNKEAAKDVGFTEDNWTESVTTAFESRLSEIIKEKGYDVIQIRPSGGKGWDVILDDKLLIREEGITLYSGLPLDEAGKAMIAGAKRAKNYVDYARGVKKFKPKEAAKALNKEFKRSFIDRSGNIRLELLNKLGDVGYRVIQKMYLTKGAYALSADKLRQMKKEVYGGLSRKEKQVADNLILYGRLLDIMGYKLLKDFKIPIDPVSGKPLTVADIAEYTEYFPYLEKISLERAKVIENRVKGYYEWMKKPLKDMLDAELISKEEYNDLIVHKYRRIRLVDIFDKKYESKLGKKKRTIYDSGIEALAKGRDTDIYEPSSEIMALEVFNRAYGRILNNEANLSLAEVAKNDPKNPFVRVKVKGETIPSGWQRFFVYEKGERKSIFLSPDMAKEWIVNSPEITYKHGQFLRYTSMSPVLRTFATGINWGFALANLPRDVMHTWYAARTFDGKEWKGVYSPHMPIFLPQIGLDLARIFPDAVTRGKRYQEYIEEGGGMEFLVHQGRIMARGRRLEGPLDKIQDVLGYFGETTEIMTRLAIRDRVIRNRAREEGISVEEARKNKDITKEATFAARDYMDFGQGGGTTKAADNAMPYLNASVQGTRGLWRVAKENPRTFVYKVAQLGAMVTLLYTAMREHAPETTEALQGSIDMQNNLCIPMGDNFAFEDAEGQTRYIYYKIPLDPSQKFFKTFFEASTDKMLGNEVDIERITNNMAEQSPVGITSLPPTLSGGIGYLYNKDLWRNKDVWRKTKPFDWPESKEEYIPGKTPQFYTDIGKATGISPERAGHAIEEVTTSGTMWSYLMGKGYEELFVDVPKSQREQHLAMVLSQMPIAKRFIGVTHPYTKYKGEFKESEQRADLEHWIQTREVDRLTEGYLFEDSVKRRDVWKYINTFKEKVVRDRLIKRFDFQVAMKDVPERSFWLRLQSLKVKAKAEVYYERWSKTKDDPEKMKQLGKEAARVEAAGGVFSDRFWDEFRKIRAEKRNE